MSERKKSGVVIWFTGLSGAGKSTMALALQLKLRDMGRNSEILDGDVVRTHLSKGLGFSKEDRDTSVKRIGFVAHLLARNGVFVITAAISPYRATRAWCREMATGDFMEVYVNAPLETCIERDVKGLYKKAIDGEIAEFTGISDPYEPPENPDVEVRTDNVSVAEGVDLVIAALGTRGYL